jgi:hypothetical protein
MTFEIYMIINFEESFLQHRYISASICINLYNSTKKIFNRLINLFTYSHIYQNTFF